MLCTMDLLADIFVDAIVEFADHAFMWKVSSGWIYKVVEILE